MQLHLKVAGIILLILAVCHFFFPGYFNWKKALSSLTLLDRQLMHVHTFFIGLILFLMGLLCLYSTEALYATVLGRQICIGLFIFWCTRLVFQFFVYSPLLWKGKVFESTVHFVFSLTWAYFSVIFLLAALGK